MMNCLVCDGPMAMAGGCQKTHLVFADGEIFEAVPYGEETRYDEEAKGTCHDCGVAVGEYHHVGCDWEECPRHGGQLLLDPECPVPVSHARIKTDPHFGDPEFQGRGRHDG